MSDSSKNKIFIELLISSLTIYAISLFFTDNPGLYKNNYILYWLIPLVFTLFYGKKVIFISLLASLITLSLTFTTFYIIYEYNKMSYHLYLYLQPLPLSLSIIIFLLYLSTLILSKYTISIDKLNKRVKKLSLESLYYKRATKALEIVNNEYELQLTRSQDSITALYRQLDKLNKLNSQFVLSTFLETIQMFIGIKKATIRAYNLLESKLELVSSIGYEDREPERFLDLNGTVEGFVFRNNQFFSIRKIKDFQSLVLSQAKNNILTVPISIDRKVWGILNIEDMPFEKYSRYSEQLIHIIVNLTEPTLKKALDYESMVQHQDLDSATGLPMFTQFYTLLEEKQKLTWKDGSSLSVIIFEIKNMAELLALYNYVDIMVLFKENLLSVFNDSSHDFLFFKYKESNQIVMVSTNLDLDGISFYLVKIFKKFSKKELLIDDSKVMIDIAVGYSTQKYQKVSTDSLLAEAENLLEISKI